MNKNIILLTFLLIGFSSSAEVYLFKQWHLSPNVNTENLIASTRIPQYTNQKDIYKKILDLKNNKNLDLLISEGCEGIVDSKFTYDHAGWTYAKLEPYKNKKNYNEIMALIPLKFKVQHPDHTVLCGDDLKLMKLNNLAFSDLRAFSSYLFKLVQYEKEPKKFKLYRDSLLEGVKHSEKIDAMEFARDKASKALSDTLRYIKLRNQSFVDIVKKHKNKSISIVIGGLHVDDLKEKLIKLGIKVIVITPKGYPKHDTLLITQLKKILKL